MSKPNSGLFPSNIKEKKVSNQGNTNKTRRKVISKPWKINKSIDKADLSKNKLNHVYRKEMHNLKDLLSLFDNDRVKMLIAIHKEVVKILSLDSLKDGDNFEKTINVKGTDVTVRGRIEEKHIRIGTIFKTEKGDKN